LCITIFIFLMVFICFRPISRVGMLRREACLTVGTTIVTVGSMWLWVAAQSTVFKLAPWSAFCAIVLVAVGSFSYSVWRIRTLTIHDDRTQGTVEPLMDMEGTIIQEDGEEAPINLQDEK
jgi:hypothetical protein